MTGAKTPLEGWSLLCAHCVSDALDLLDARPFVAGHPLRIRVHGSDEWRSRPVSVGVSSASIAMMQLPERSAHREMGKHIPYGPFTGLGKGHQLSLPQTFTEVGEARGCGLTDSYRLTGK